MKTICLMCHGESGSRMKTICLMCHGETLFKGMDLDALAPGWWI